MIVIGGVDAHAGAGDAVLAETDPSSDAVLDEFPVRGIDVELVGLRVVAEGDVWPAVAIGVENSDAERFGSRISEAGCGGRIFEGAVALIVPDAHRGAFVGLGRAIRFRFAVDGAVNVGLRRPLHVISYHQIEKAVAVVIDKGRAGAEFVRPPEAGLLGDVGKGSVTIIFEKVVLAQRSDENIVVAVVVVIADGYAHAVHFDVEAGFSGDVGEGAVVIIVIESGMRCAAVMLGKIGAVDEENILPAVVIGIDEGNAGAHGFRQIFFAEGAVVMDEVNAGGFGYVFEANGGRLGILILPVVRGANFAGVEG